MTPAETAKVLAACAAFDQRTVGTADVAAWHSALHELDYADARDAVTRHYRLTAERIMPVHILRSVAAHKLEQILFDVTPIDGHAFVGNGIDCETCGLPATNRHHRQSAA